MSDVPPTPESPARLRLRALVDAADERGRSTQLSWALAADEAGRGTPLERAILAAVAEEDR